MLLIKKTISWKNNIILLKTKRELLHYGVIIVTISYYLLFNFLIMIKNKNVQAGLIVFVVTLIGLITFAQLHPKDNLDIIENQHEKSDVNKQDNLDIAIH